MRFSTLTFLLLPVTFTLASPTAPLISRADPPRECQEINLPLVEYGDLGLYCCEAIIYPETVENTELPLPIDTLLTALSIFFPGIGAGRSCRPIKSKAECDVAGRQERTVCCGKQQLLANGIKFPCKASRLDV